MAITQFTNLPNRNQGQGVFVERANNFLGVQLPRFVTEANDLAEAVNEDAAQAEQSREAADQSQLAAEAFAARAESAEGNVLGVLSFKGEWSALSGPLAPPASVRHAGRLWVLTANLPNVALSEPGVDVSKWEPAHRGMTVAVNDFAAFSGDDLICASATPVTITLPAGPSAGAWVAVTRAGSGAVIVNRNGSTIVNVADNVTIDRDVARFVFVFAGGTWRIIMEGVVA